MEIEGDLKRIFGSHKAVKKVPYNSRTRCRFPCPVESCGFATVDLGKHLLSKHKWTPNEVRLQTNYFNAMLDFISSINTYRLHKPMICFKCAIVFDRINNQLHQIHFDRGSSEYRETLGIYEKESHKLLYSNSSFQDQEIHNVQKILFAIENFQKGIMVPEPDTETQQEQHADTDPTSHPQRGEKIVTDKEVPGPSRVQVTQKSKF